jgi:hypothetical protein
MDSIMFCSAHLRASLSSTPPHPTDPVRGQFADEISRRTARFDMPSISAVSSMDISRPMWSPLFLECL